MLISRSVMEIDASADRLARALLSRTDGPVLLDSCGVGRGSSNLLIAGVRPVEVISIQSGDPENTLRELDAIAADDSLAAIFTLSYEFGEALNGLAVSAAKPTGEPQLFAALFDTLVLHDYRSKSSWIAGAGSHLDELLETISASADAREVAKAISPPQRPPCSSFLPADYVGAVEQVKELIRAGETYQTNLTQQIRVPLADGTTPQEVFLNLRRDNPAAFAAFIDRGHSVVVSASPELFIKVDSTDEHRIITASPVKGTRPRGSDPQEDTRLRRELSISDKDLAENTMIVDLMRNDLGRVCEFGTVAVEDLGRVEEHPTLFHLVSTVKGVLRPEARTSDILRATFPCGSITGAPKIRTMEIIRSLENLPRGLSMGAIGCRIPAGCFGTREIFEMSVAIRTMVIRGGEAVFNVGGGIVSDSDTAAEYEESMLKAKALLTALGAPEWRPLLP